MITRNRARQDQTVDFSGLRFGPGGRIWPTDIDAVLEFRTNQEDGGLLVFIETKFREHAVDQRGQRVAQERIIDAAAIAGVNAILIHSLHDTVAPDPIDLAEAEVVGIYWPAALFGPGEFLGERRGGFWTPSGLTVREVVDQALIHFGVRL